MASVVTVPDPVLRRPVKRVTSLDKRTLKVIEDMYAVLKATKNPEGVGLAAPQIGISLAIFLLRPEPKDEITLFINPQITKLSQRKQNPDSKDGIYEGCLSIPNHYAPITRSMSVTVKYQTVGSENQLVEKTETFTGLMAHIIQHETDHLNGILFIDHVLNQNSKLFYVKGKTWQEVTL